jgi:protein TonB
MVTLRFTLHADGRITEESIATPSHYGLLNDATLDIIRTSLNHRYKPFPEEMGTSPRVIEVPIEYILR